MRLPTLLSLLALLVASPLLAQNPPPILPLDDYAARTVTDSSGATLGYRLLSPAKYDAAQRYPLVVILHGSGERGSNNSAQLKYGSQLFLEPAARQKFPCFVLMPQCPLEQKWAEIDWSSDTPKQPATLSNPARLLLDAIEAVKKEFSIDADRIYLGGLSMGGYGTWDLITRFPEKFAAAVPICGGGDKEVAARAKDVPIWAFHGVEDKAVKVERTREMIAAIKAAGGSPLYSEYPYVAHNSWDNAFKEPELLPWLFAQKRGQKPVDFVTVAGPFAQPPSSVFPGEGPTQSGLWFRGLWKGRREQWNKDVAKDQNAVVFFGDSITQGWGSMEQDFAGFKVANRGISGDTTRGLRYRLKGDVLDLKPRAVSILIGTNDLDQGAEPEVVVENLRAIVNELHAANPAMPIVINKVMPRGNKTGKFPEKIVKLNGLYEQAFGKDPLITFCDTWTIFDDGTGQCKKEEFPDMLHPNPAGYAKWTAALKPILEKLNLK